MSTLRVSGIVIWLTVLWVMLWGSVSFANVASGLLAAIGVVALSRLPRFQRVAAEDRTGFRPVAVVWFHLVVLVKLVEANLILAKEIITPRNKIFTGVIAVQLRTESEMAMTITANVITLTPGTVTVESVGSPATLYVHVLHLHDLEKVRADVLKLEELAIRAFGPSSERRRLRERSQ